MLITTLLVTIATADFTPTIELLTPSAQWIEAAVDDQGLLRNKQGTEVGTTALAWMPLESTAPTAAQRPFAVLTVNDGQVVPGAFGGFVGEATESSVRWKHMGLGMIDLPSAQIASIQFQPTLATARATESDELVLRNGDVVRGFIEKFGDPMVIDRSGQTHEVPIDRVASLALVTAARPAGAVRVWITDGTVIDGTALHALRSGDDVSFVLEGVSLITGRPPLALMPQEILAVRTSTHRILPLCTLSPTTLPPTTPALPRAEYPQPTTTQQNPPLAAAALEIRGPLRLIYEIPQGFTTFNATAELPPSMRTWGDCCIVIRQAGTELARYPISTKNPTAKIHVAIHAGALEIEIEEGSGGPIGDTIILRRAILVVADGQG